jgi:hypothetical protein
MGWAEIDKPGAKARLGLSPDRPVALTIGSEHYFKPSNGQSFFDTLSKLLAMRRDLQVLVVGVGEDSEFVPSSIRDTGQVRLVGRVADPRPFYEAADVCMESFPMPSLGALVEAVAFGQAFPVPAFAPTETPLRVNLHAIASAAVRQPTEADYIRYICELLDNREATSAKAAELRRAIIRSDEEFGDQFESLYSRISALGHLPRELPRAPFSTAPENLALASMSNLADIGRTINALLPLVAALAAHAGTARKRYATPPVAAARMARYIGGRAVRRLPEGLRRRLRSR